MKTVVFKFSIDTNGIQYCQKDKVRFADDTPDSVIREAFDLWLHDQTEARWRVLDDSD